MKSTAKVLPSAAGARETARGLQAINSEFEDLFAELRDAGTVVAVAMETWSGGQHDQCVGVLDLLSCKLEQIEHEAKNLMARAKGGKS